MVTPPHARALSESSNRAAILPVGTGDRPLWSVMIPAYNCAHYIAIAIRSVLAQDLGESSMQIEVVDDHSDDEIERVVAEVGAGRVAFHRQATNVGHTRNFETCLQRARGEIVHLLHGDDAVHPGFYAALGGPLVARPELGAAFCRYEAINESGEVVATGAAEQQEAGAIDGWLERIALGQRLQTPSIVVRRSVYEALGGFDQRLHYGEDWEMWVRIAAHYPVWYEPRTLARYRVHTRSSSASDLRTGANVKDLRLAIELNRAWFSPDEADRISRRALDTTATTALRRAARSAGTGDLVTARAQARAAFATSLRPTVWTHAAYYTLAAGRAWAAGILATRRSGRS